jgi:hypothetical protein
MGLSLIVHLNRIRYFHVAERTILIDCMYDFLEGVGLLVPFIIKLVFYIYITKGLYGILAEILNSRLKRFQYRFYDQCNKPSAKFTT